MMLMVFMGFVLCMAASYTLLSKAEKLEEGALSKTRVKKALHYEILGAGVMFAGVMMLIGIYFFMFCGNTF